MISNAYDMLKLLRDNVNEATASHWSELNLLRRLNQAYYGVARIVSQSRGQWLVKSASVTASDSVITLPDDCSKPIYMEDSEDRPVDWINSVAHRRVTRPIGSSQDLVTGKEAYPLKNTLEINSDSDSDTYTLWYQQRIVELHAGTAAAGAATSLTLAADLRANVEDDYYNNAELEVISGTGIGRHTISDYVASTRVCTMATGTFSTDSVYGIVPTTPQECNDYIVLRATILSIIKPSSTLDEAVVKYYLSEARRAKEEMKEWLDSRIIENVGVSIGEPYL